MKLAKDEQFRRFILNPKVQALMRDPEFKRAVQEKDMAKLRSNSGFNEVLNDAEIREALVEMRKMYEKR